ncbi:MAG TPA: hypothetical protein VFZ91_06305 [Allosphingosinicella sp.]
MADGQHSRTDGGVPAAGRETARRASLEVSRRTLLGAVCAAPVLSPVIPAQAGTPARSAPSPSPWDPGLRRDDELSSAVPVWDRALARFQTAQAALDAAAHEPNQDVYDALLGAHSGALTALLALPAPDPAALAAKLEIIVPHLAWEHTGAEDCLEILRQDAHRLAATPA